MADSADVVRSAYQAFAEADIPRLLEQMGERVTWDVTAVLPQGGSWRGRDGVGEFFEKLGGAWADLGLEIEQTVHDGDTVAMIGRAAGRLRAHGARSEEGR